LNQNGKNQKRGTARPAPRKNPAAAKKIPAGGQAQSSRQVKARPQAVPGQQRTARPAARRTIAPAPAQNAQRQGQIARTIKAQTPSQRQAQRSGKRITGSVKNMEVRHSTKTTKKQFRVKKQKPTLRIVLYRLAAFFVCYAVVFGMVCALFFLNLTHITGIAGSEYVVQIGEDDTDTMVKYRSAPNIVGANGTYNVSIDAMRKLCEFTVTGEADTLRYIPRGNSGQSATFVVGTDIAYLNGVMIHMESQSFVYGNQLYLPISFFKNYVKNVQVTHNTSEEKITVTRVETPESFADIKKDPDEAVFEPIVFLLSENKPLANITEESVDNS